MQAAMAKVQINQAPSWHAARAVIIPSTLAGHAENHDGIWKVEAAPDNHRNVRTHTLVEHGRNHDGIWRIRAGAERLRDHRTLMGHGRNHDGIWKLRPPPDHTRSTQIPGTLVGHGGNHDGIWRVRYASGPPEDHRDTKHSGGTRRESRWYLEYLDRQF